MADSNYPDDGGLNEPGEDGKEVMDPNQKPESDTDKDDDKEGAGESALIPKSLCPGMDLKPGDKIPLVVRAVHGDEIEVEYEADDKPGADSEGRPMGKARAGMADRLSAMADM